MTITEIGDEVVCQLPGTGWAITFDDRQLDGRVTVGLLCEQGWWQVYVDLDETPD